MAIYMKVPNVKGSVTTKGYDNGWIKLHGFNFGVQRHMGMETGDVSNRSASLPHFNEVSGSKEMDQASSGLMNAAVLGKKGQKIDIVEVDVDEDKVHEIAKYELEDSIFASYGVSGAAGEAHPTENFSISFAKLTVTFQSSYKAGTNADKPRVIYNLATATK